METKRARPGLGGLLENWMDLQSKCKPLSQEWIQWIKCTLPWGRLSQVQEVSTHQERGDEGSKTGASRTRMELGVRTEVKHEAEEGHAVLLPWSCVSHSMGRSRERGQRTRT